MENYMKNIIDAIQPMTFASEINRALSELLKEDPSVVVGGQLVRYGVAGLTTGLFAKFPSQFITYSVSESLMNSSAMGLALAGKRVVMMHVRMDFLASGMCALVNHVPIWSIKGVKLPITYVCQVGKGMGQGAQHSKDLTRWFKEFEGWTVRVPQTPQEAYAMLMESVRGDKPIMYVLHRELFDATAGKKVPEAGPIRLCGASQRHEQLFYGESFISGESRVK
jgi:pyruvate/2-oxoglutarate/acetoin dehydrogenase E1 component